MVTVAVPCFLLLLLLPISASLSAVSLTIFCAFAAFDIPMQVLQRRKGKTQIWRRRCAFHCSPGECVRVC